jgi:hypothetical protein
MRIKLKEFEGYTIDLRLKEFRIIKDSKIEFIKFNSDEGKTLLNKYIKNLNKESEEFKELINKL